MVTPNSTREQNITREQIIVVNKVDKNSYGDLVFTDKENGEYKVSNKRIQYFEKIISPDTAVKLSYAMSSFGKEYIYKAEKVSDALSSSKDLGKPFPPHQDEIDSARKAGKALARREDAPRSMLLAYAKDIKVALIRAGVKKDFTLTDAVGMCSVAELWETWCKGEMSVQELYQQHKPETTKES